jgi:hypothetical protein
MIPRTLYPDPLGKDKSTPWVTGATSLEVVCCVGRDCSDTCPFLGSQERNGRLGGPGALISGEHTCSSVMVGGEHITITRHNYSSYKSPPPPTWLCPYTKAMLASGVGALVYTPPRGKHREHLLVGSRCVELAYALELHHASYKLFRFINDQLRIHLGEQQLMTSELFCSGVVVYRFIVKSTTMCSEPHCAFNAFVNFVECVWFRVTQDADLDSLECHESQEFLCLQ